jgi:hypothetical protein
MRLVLVVLAGGAGCARGAPAGHDDGNVDTGGSGSGSSDAQVIDSAVVAPDANNCPVQPCTIFPQCGCPTTQKPACDLAAGSASGNACRFAPTTGGVEGTSCISSQGCAASYTCVGDGTNFQCEKYCASNTDCGSPRGQCVTQLVDSGGTAIPGAVMCTSNCDPSTATNSLCPSNWTCDLFTATFMATSHNIVDCRIDGPQAANASCATQACAAGLSCVTISGSNVCKKLCNKTNNTGCTSGTCTSFGTAFSVGGTEYGVCL